MTWAKNEPIDEERERQRWIRDTQKWAAATMRGIAQLHRMPPADKPAARAWMEAARIADPEKARRR